MKFILILFFTFCVIATYSQVDAVVGLVGKALPQLVTIPDLEASNAIVAEMQTSMNATTLRMEAESKALKQLLQLATWANNLETVRRLASMIENTICFSSSLNMKVGMYSGNCLYQFQWNMQIVKINCAVDQLSLVIADGIEMTTGERLAGIDRAVTQFHQAQSGLQSLNSVIDRRLMAMARTTQDQKTRSYLLKLHR